jgi:ABC-type metal ion transport system substrate-binding protein
MWGELPRWQYFQHQQQLKKEKEDHKLKIERVRKTLDQQILD